MRTLRLMGSPNRTFLFFLCLAVLAGALVTSPPVKAATAEAEETAHEATSPIADLRARFLAGGVRILPSASASWRLDVGPIAVTQDGETRTAEPVRLAVGGDRVDYGFGSLVEGSYENTRRGLVQTLEISSPPSDGGSLVLELGLAGDLVPKLDRVLHQLDFLSGSRVVLRFADLQALDAAGNEVPVRLEVNDSGSASIVVERPGSAYPVTVQGTFVTPKIRRSATSFDQIDPGDTLIPMAPPANDLCSGATVIPAAGPFPHLTGTTNLADATTTGDPVARPSCAFPGEPVTRSIWYAFTPTQSATYTFTSCADAPTATTVDDTVMAIFTSSAACTGPFSEVIDGCDDDSCLSELQSFVSAPLAAGTTYYVVVWNLGPAPTAGNTSVQLVVTSSANQPPPANDECGGAETIPAAGPFPYLTATTADITGAGTAGDPDPPTCNPGGGTSRSIWYTFTPADTATYTFSSCGADFGGTATTVDDTILAIYTSTASCAGTFSELPTSGLSDGCDDDGCPTSLQSALTTVLTGGTQYYIVVSKVGAGMPPIGHTAVQLRVTKSATPPNDSCVNALSLAVDTPLAGTTASAANDYGTQAIGACYSGVGQTTSSAAGRDVAYSFTAPSSASYSFRVTGYDPTLSRNLVTYVTSDCPTAGNPPRTVTCLKGANRNASFSSEEVNCLPLTLGTTVYAYVDENAVTAGSPFTIEVNRCITESEPNDTPAASNVRSCGVQGAVGLAGDADFWGLGAPATGSRLFAMVDGAAGNTTDFDLRMTSDVDTLEFDDLNLDTPFGSLSPVLAGTPHTGVQSYLRVSVNSVAIAAEPYRLYSVVQAPIASAVAEIEPNDATAQATESPLGYFSGALAAPAPSADIDLFAFDANVGDLIFLGLDGDPARNNTPIQGALALLDTGGNTLISVNDGAFTSSTTAGTGALNKTVPFSPAEGLTWRARYTGRHYAKVYVGTSSTASYGAGDYLLSISLRCSPTDQDGDGVPITSDCAPADASAFAIPSEVANVLFAADRQTLSWTAAGGGTGTTHDVLRGDLSGLPVGPGGGDETCFADIAGTSTVVAGDPAVGTGYWYLVRGGNACGNGTFGAEGIRGTVGSDRVSTTCP